MDRLIKSVPGRVATKFLKDLAPNWAILIAWNGLFAMFPIVVFASSLLGIALHVFGVSSDKIYTTAVQVIPDPAIRDQVIAALGGVKSQTGILFIVGLIGLLWGGSALFGAMEQAFAYIYRTRPRDFLQQKLVAFGMVLLFTALAGIAVGTAAILPALKDIPNIPSALTSDAATFMLQVLVGITAGFILFQSIYFVIPNRRQNWLKVVPGALVAGVLFELVTLLFPLYLSLNKGINQYGSTFGLFFVLMTFFFSIGLITMVGVEVNSVLYPEEVEHGRRHRAAPPVPAVDDRSRQRGAAQPRPSPNGTGGPVRSGIKARTAVLIAVSASVIGLLLGRRSTGNG